MFSIFEPTQISRKMGSSPCLIDSWEVPKLSFLGHSGEDAQGEGLQKHSFFAC